jgi:HK97 family phage prohead protease
MQSNIFSVSGIEFVKSASESEKGTFKGIMASQSKDRNGDVIAPDAFNKTIQDHIARKRNIRMFYQHNMRELPIGHIDPRSIKQVDGRWEVVGNLAVDTDLGGNVYKLMKHGTLSDLSIHGFVKDADYRDDGTRFLKEVDLLEVSVVSEPAQPDAAVDVATMKSVNPSMDLPLADKGRQWDSSAAVKRIRSFTKSEDAPSESYKKAFFYFDESNKDNFTAYKLPFADVIGGRLMAVPRAIFAVLQAIRGARSGGVDIPDADKTKVLSAVKSYYKKMDMEFPTGKSFLEYEDVMDITSKRVFEDVLRDSGLFSKKAATFLASFFESKSEQSDSVKTDDVVLQEETSKKLDDLVNSISNLIEDK